MTSQKFDSNNRKLGVALVGLGYYATEQLAPALQQTAHCYLAGIVTGSPSKVKTWTSKYNIPTDSIYHYEDFDAIRDNPSIDIVYIVLPNHLHEEYTIRAAQAGKHVICEKPMALNVQQCDNMIDACNKAGKLLSIGYRLHFDPVHLETISICRSQQLGKIKNINASFSIMPKRGEWRLNKAIAGGGPLMDVGIYCVQAVCYLTGREPISVSAQQYPVSDPDKFIGVEERVSFQLEMPDGLIAQCDTSYAGHDNYLKVETEKGFIELEPAFNYTDIKGKTPHRAMMHPVINQQALQLDAFALSIKQGLPSVVPGEMGRRDVKIIQAIYEAMETGERVML